jgi:hypothetical protein
MTAKALNPTTEVAQAIAAGMPPCPNCSGRNVRRSESVRFEDKVMLWLRYTPYRCRTCQHRFYKRPDLHRAIPHPESNTPTASWLVGFHLWLEGDLAWAQGTYEYRPMGAAVISTNDLFRRRDFSARRQPPHPYVAEYVGQFASIGHLNGELQRRRAVAKARSR